MAPVQALRHCLVEAKDGLVRHPALTVLAALAIAVSLYVFGGFLLVAFNLGVLSTQLAGEMEVQIYMKAGASEQEIAALRGSLIGDEAVAHARFVTAEESRRRFETRFPGLKDLPGEVGGEIFPPAFEVVLRPSYQDADAAERLARVWRRAAGVEEVRFDRAWFERLAALLSLLRSGGYGVGALLLAAVMVTTGAVVRLTVLARREEIDIMKLVGATAAFIRAPFLFGAAAQGLAGGLVALAGLRLTWRLVIRSTPFHDNPIMSMVAGRFLPPATSTALVAAGLVLATAAAALSLRRAGAAPPGS
ncbi:MAG TPA: permease-like cell division protein FtsX [Patescibacteria group bacterium]|nr:permease-like cell division protein FtsX [Patescibacteria group bacterium]